MKQQLSRLVNKHGLRPVLNTLAELCEYKFAQTKPLLLDPHDGEEMVMIDDCDLMTAAANLRGDLF